MKINSKKEEFSDSNRSRYSSRELGIGRVTFEFYKDEKALIQLDLIEEAVKRLELEFKDYTPEDIITGFRKQLVINLYK